MTVYFIETCEISAAQWALLAPYARVKDAALRDWPAGGVAAAPAMAGDPVAAPCAEPTAPAPCAEPAVSPTCGLFMAESLPTIQAALSAGYTPCSMLVEKGLWLQTRCALRGFSWPAGAPIMVASAKAFAHITGYETVRAPLVAFCRKPLPAPATLLAGARRVAVLEDVGNYANIGAAFRAAHAFDIDAVLVTPSCHDPLYRRALRHSKGAVLQVPWARIGTAREWASEGVPLLHQAGFKVAELALERRSIALGSPELAAQEKLALVLGTEGEGLLPSTIAAADYTVKIPMAHEVDSLNVAAASAVAFWELCRK